MEAMREPAKRDASAWAALRSIVGAPGDPPGTLRPRVQPAGRSRRKRTGLGPDGRARRKAPEREIRELRQAGASLAAAAPDRRFRQ